MNTSTPGAPRMMRNPASLMPDANPLRRPAADPGRSTTTRPDRIAAPTTPSRTNTREPARRPSRTWDSGTTAPAPSRSGGGNTGGGSPAHVLDKGNNSPTHMLHHRSALFIVIGLLCGVHTARGQSEEDALRFSNLLPGGTARSWALGGAIGAVGADPGSVTTNPAGLGLYNTSEFSLTPQFEVNNSRRIITGRLQKTMTIASASTTSPRSSVLQTTQIATGEAEPLAFPSIVRPVTTGRNVRSVKECPPPFFKSS